ncbi:hypothetical protein HDU67_006345 [Dinochytrium kinnereticum]|nr:hypothetical protein HDU67_006345 [Dinochytrium kinnereticum]
MTKAAIRAAWKTLFRPSKEVAISGRSSHSVSVIGNTAYIFSGELLPRVPVDNKLEAFDLSNKAWLKAFESPAGDLAAASPSPRVGHGTATLGDTIYLFGGRGGPEMAPLEPTLFAFNGDKQRWGTVDAKGRIPAARSFHSMTASKDHVYLFGGCPESGRLNDFYRFDPATNSWTELPSHPDISVRGGPGLAALGDRIILFGGFNGTELDDLWIYDIASNRWEAGVWSTDSVKPIARSVFGFVPLDALGKIAVFYGECDPSAQGHSGAGKYLDDVLLLSFDEEGRACFTPVEVDSPVGEKPTPRGWVAAAPWMGTNIAMFGGYDGNDRDNGMYLLSFSN